MRQPIPFGKYLLLERISVGGMAEVFKAKSFGVEGFEKIIAIKRILPTMVEDADFIQMFIDEAKIAGQLSHANICQIFELGKIAESHFIAMEFVWGKDLLQIQNRFRKLRQPVPVSMAAFIAAKMCEGLDYAHKKKDARGNPLFIVHRDVSPQNILVSYEGEIKLIDFGIAKATTRSSKTQAGVLKGKFGYMSPEQVRGLPLDRRSDLFALGTILYEMLTAERLFLGESDFSTLERVRNVDIQPPSRHNRNVPPALEKIVMKALAKEPEDRYQWANELQDELLQFVMAQPQVFTAKQLAAWMKEAFSPELARERQLLEQYKRLGRDGQVGPPSSPVVSIAPPPAREVTAPTATDTRESDEPSFEDLLEDSLSASVSLDVPLPGASASAPTVRPGSTGSVAAAGRAAPVASGTGAASAFVSASASSGHGRVSKGGSAGFGDEGPTEIFGEVESRSPTAGPKVGPESTVILPGSGTPPPPAPAPVPAPVVAAGPPSLTAVPSALGLARAPSSAGGGPAPAPLGLAFASPPSMAQLAPAGVFPAATPLGTAPPGVGAVDRGATADVPRLQPAAPSRQRQLLRDVAVAAGVAVLVLGLIVGGKLLFFGLRRPAPVVAPAVTTGTIVVAAADNGVGDVYVNGQKRGELYAGADPLQIEGLPGGDYDITVKRAGVPDYVQRVRLDVHRPEVVFCRFEQPAPQHGKLVLHIKTEGVTVLVDNQEISADAAREPLLLAPRVEHVITFQREGYLAESLQLALADGEVQERDIELEPAEAAKPKKTKKPVEPPAEDGAPAPAPVEAPAVAMGPLPAPAAEGDVGFLIANTTPYAKVLIDAKDTGKMTPIAPRAKIPLKPGKHTVTFVVGEESFPYPIMIEAGKDHRLIKTLPVE